MGASVAGIAQMACAGRGVLGGGERLLSVIEALGEAGPAAHERVLIPGRERVLHRLAQRSHGRGSVPLRLAGPAETFQRLREQRLVPQAPRLQHRVVEHDLRFRVASQLMTGGRRGELGPKGGEAARGRRIGGRWLHAPEEPRACAGVERRKGGGALQGSTHFARVKRGQRLDRLAQVIQALLQARFPEVQQRIGSCAAETRAVT